MSWDQLPLVLQQLILEQIDSFAARAKACCVSKAWRKDAARWIAHATRKWPGGLAGQPLSAYGGLHAHREHSAPSPYFAAGTLLPPYWAQVDDDTLFYGISTAPVTEAEVRAYCRARCASEKVYRLTLEKLIAAAAEKFGGTELGLYKVKFFGMGSLGRPTTSDIFQLLKQVAPAVELTDAAGALLNDFFVALTRAFTSKGTQDVDVLGAIDELVPDSTWLQEAAQTGQLTLGTQDVDVLGDDETEHMMKEEIRDWPSDTLLRAVETAMVEVLSTASEEAIEEQRTTVASSLTFAQKVLGAEPIARLLDSDPAWGQIRPSLLGGRHAACETWEATLAFPIPLGSNNAAHLDVMRVFEEEYPTDEENDYVEGDPKYGLEDAVSRIACALKEWGAESIRAVHFHPDCDSNSLHPTIIVGELPGPALCGFAFLVDRQD